MHRGDARRLGAQHCHSGFVAVQVIGEQWTPRCHEIRDLLARNSIPNEFHAPDSDTAQCLPAAAGVDDRPSPC